MFPEWDTVHDLTLCLGFTGSRSGVWTHICMPQRTTTNTGCTGETCTLLRRPVSLTQPSQITDLSLGSESQIVRAVEQTQLSYETRCLWTPAWEKHSCILLVLTLPLLKSFPDVKRDASTQSVNWNYKCLKSPNPEMLGRCVKCKQKDVIWMGAYVALKLVCTFQHWWAFPDVHVTSSVGTNVLPYHQRCRLWTESW